MGRTPGVHCNDTLFLGLWRPQPITIDNFFRARLEQMINMRLALGLLATRMPWAQIEASLALHFDARNVLRVLGDDARGVDGSTLTRPHGAHQDLLLLAGAADLPNGLFEEARSGRRYDQSWPRRTRWCRIRGSALAHLFLIRLIENPHLLEGFEKRSSEEVAVGIWLHLSMSCQSF